MADTDTFVEGLETLLRSLRREELELSEKANAITSERKAAELTLATYRRRMLLPESVDSESRLSTNGTSLMERRRQALKQLARENGNQLIVRIAKNPMIEAGLYENARKFRTQIYSTMNDMGCWKKERRGVYSLTEEASTTTEAPGR